MLSYMYIYNVHVDVHVADVMKYIPSKDRLTTIEILISKDIVHRLPTKCSRATDQLLS